VASNFVLGRLSLGALLGHNTYTDHNPYGVVVPRE